MRPRISVLTCATAVKKIQQYGRLVTVKAMKGHYSINIWLKFVEMCNVCVSKIT